MFEKYVGLDLRTSSKQVFLLKIPFKGQESLKTYTHKMFRQNSALYDTARRLTPRSVIQRGAGSHAVRISQFWIFKNCYFLTPRSDIQCGATNKFFIKK